MARYTKRPVVIEAVQWLGDHWDEEPRPQWVSDAVEAGALFYQGGPEPYWTVRTLEGDMRLGPYAWLIKGVEGELYPCANSVFAKTYERSRHA